ncbi:hypothetical protein [Streptosporangium sp. KLBMP 9127]|nr:hypothetical protein [Streptosporangium sp. KLBMP 9127]
MDVHDPALRVELDRRLEALERDEDSDPAHDPLPRADLWALLAIVAALTLLGWALA